MPCFKKKSIYNCWICEIYPIWSKYVKTLKAIAKKTFYLQSSNFSVVFSWCSCLKISVKVNVSPEFPEFFKEPVSNKMFPEERTALIACFILWTVFQVEYFRFFQNIKPLSWWSSLFGAANNGGVGAKGPPLVHTPLCSPRLSIQILYITWCWCELIQASSKSMYNSALLQINVTTETCPLTQNYIDVVMWPGHFYEKIITSILPEKHIFWGVVFV